MRIRELHIEGFGCFADWHCGPFERPVTLFHGANEAGKSTLLEFIRRLLFGFPHAGQNPYPRLNERRHGGQLTLASDEGDTMVVERFRWPGGRSLVLTGQDGRSLHGSRLSDLLGNQDVFQNIFAFTLDELHDDALLNNEHQVNSHIYSVGMGVKKLPSAFKTLKDKKSDLFLNKGSKHKIYLVAKKLDSVEAHLKTVADNAQNYANLSATLENIDAKLTELREQRRAIDRQLNKQRQLESAWPHWIDFLDTGRRLAELPAIQNFPAEGISRLETLEERIGTARTERDSATRDVEEARIGSDVQIVHETIREHTDIIRRLEQDHTSFSHAVRDLPGHQAECARCRADLDQTLRDLGKDWDDARLNNIDLSLAVREEISQYDERLQTVNQQLQERRSSFDRDAQLLQDAVAAQQEAQQRLDAVPEPDLDQEQANQRSQALGRAKPLLGRIEAVQRQADGLQLQLDHLEASATPRGRNRGDFVFSVVGFIFGFAFLAAGVVLGGGGIALILAILAGVPLISMALFLFRKVSIAQHAESPLAAPIRESLGRAEEELATLRSDLEREAALLGLTAIDETSLITGEEMLRVVNEQLGKRASLTQTLQQTINVIEKRRSQERQSKQAVEQAQKHLQRMRDRWQEWLETRGLQEHLSPTTVSELRTKMELGRAQLRAWRDCCTRIDGLQQVTGDYTGTIRPLATEFGLADDFDNPHETIKVANRLVNLLDQVDRQVQQRTTALENLQQAQRQLDERNQNLREAMNERRSLLELGGADNTETFRQRAEQLRQREGLKQERDGAAGHLQRLSGPGQPLEDLKRALENTDNQAILDEIGRLEDQRSALEENIESLSNDLGDNRSQLNGLIGEEASSKMRMQRDGLIEEMRGHARSWAVCVVAENLLKETQGKFERERQPEVLRHAQDCLGKITDQRYTEVTSPLGTSKLRIKGSAGNAKEPNQLSRGTREQLFLSLRFGLIRELGQRSERLPVIVDEALVNFDPKRGAKAASAFLDLAETNQVLVFTCHPQIVGWFTAAAEKKGSEPLEVIDI